MHRKCTWSRTNGVTVSFCSKDCFYAFYKLGNAPKSVSAGSSPRTRWGSLQRSLRPLAGGEGARCVLPKNPTPSSALRALAIQVMLCRPPTPPKINPSYGLRHPYKLYKAQCENSKRRHFFTERIVNVWNSMPANVDFSSMPRFKQSVEQVDFYSFCSVISYNHLVRF